MIGDGDRLGWLEIFFFGSGFIVFCVSMLPGSAYLKLDSNSFTFCSLFRPHTLRWDEVEAFGVTTIALRKMVAFNFSELHGGHRRMRKISSVLSGYEAALPDTYGRKAEELAALMNEWRMRDRAAPVNRA